MGSEAVPIVLAAGAAVCFGLGMAWEHRGAAGTTPRRSVHPGLVVDLLKSRHFRIGLSLTVCGYAMQATAFGSGRLVQAEPILTLSLVVALATSGFLHHRPLTRHQWAAVLATTGAVIVFTATTAPAAGRETAPIGAWLPWLAGVGGAGVAAALASPHWPRRWRATSLALAGGALYGTSDALTKTVADSLAHHGTEILATWPLYALVAAGTAAFLAQQTAYHSGRLADTQPALSVTEPVVGSLIGITVLREHVRTGPVLSAVDALAVVVMAAGVIALGRLADRVELGDSADCEPASHLDPGPGRGS
jgi:drug/metabolite transporter (DMT)-like permease